MTFDTIYLQKTYLQNGIITTNSALQIVIRVIWPVSLGVGGRGHCTKQIKIIPRTILKEKVKDHRVHTSQG